MPSSNCNRSFTHHDFSDERAPWKNCPVIDCTSTLAPLQVGKPVLVCEEHGIRLHLSDTFVYYNGPTRQDSVNARLRNIVIAGEYVREHVFESSEKAETYRLGYELSEDALTWNIFVALMVAGKLRTAATWLTGQPVGREPDLYLWGSLVDLHGRKPSLFPPLKRIRKLLEPKIVRYPTEPDIMLVVPGELVICIEAKFTSGNPWTSDTPSKLREKPNSTAGLIARYLDAPERWTKESESVERVRLPSGMPKQLFRNVVFAARMAECEGTNARWHLVNLVSATQWQRQIRRGDPGFEDPTKIVQQMIPDLAADQFTFRTWEDLYSSVVEKDIELSPLATYLKGKSARFVPAFDFQTGPN